MLNDPRVRERLAARGLDIPAEHGVRRRLAQHVQRRASPISTWTACRSRHRPRASTRVQAIIEQACDRNAHERCRRFVSAPLTMSLRRRPGGTSRRGRKTWPRRGPSAATRPTPSASSAAAAGRAACTSIAGRSSPRTIRRRTTPTHTILTRLLQAAVPVCGGINLEYYFSYVDNAGYGCGTKLPHNVTSLLGVMDGAASDLRTGLPWQMVEIHEPVRLLFVIETTPEAMLRDHGPQPGHRPAVPQRLGAAGDAQPRFGADSRVARRPVRAVPARSDRAAAGRVVGRLVSRLARPPGVRRRSTAQSHVPT